MLLRGLYNQWMVRFATISVLVVCSLGVASAQGNAVPRRDLVGKQFDARVVRVADGDTLEAIPSGEARPIRIRLHGIDAPETGEVFSREAQTFLRTLLFDRRVRVEGRDVDRYSRLVARITIAGKDASVELLRVGFACHAYARDTALANEEAVARLAGRGFWSVTSKKPACVQRQSSSGPGGAVATVDRPASRRRRLSRQCQHPCLSRHMVSELQLSQLHSCLRVGGGSTGRGVPSGRGLHALTRSTAVLSVCAFPRGSRRHRRTCGR